MELREKISELVEEIITGTDLYLVDVKGAAGGKTKISILLDSDEGINIDDCARVSRKLGERIEEMNLLENAYVLEVSSPGIDEPLRLHRQYVKNTGRSVQVTLVDNSIKKGILEEVRNESIIISEKGKKKNEVIQSELPFKDIKKTNVIVSFK